MTTYSATATREGNWWVLDVDGVGVTQVARLTEANAQIRGLVEAVTDADVPEDAAIEVRLEGPADVAIRQAREDTAAAEQARDMAAAAWRRAVLALVDHMRISQSEAAVVLNVSKQRVAQLIADARAEQGARLQRAATQVAPSTPRATVTKAAVTAEKTRRAGHAKKVTARKAVHLQ